MKGIIFTTLNDMIVEKFGLEVWETLLQRVKLASGGIYTAGDTYPFEELQALVIEFAKMQKMDAPKLIEAYGLYMFPVLAKKYPIFLQGHKTLASFLKSIDQVIHVEVMKLYPDAELPSIKYEEQGSAKLALLYKSPRKLCFLAEGLIQGAAQYFKVKAKINQPVCMHKQGDHCRLEVTIGN